MDTVYVVIADGSIDIIQTGKVHVDKHVKDLKKMGCEVKVKSFPTWAAAEAFEDKFNAR